MTRLHLLKAFSTALHCRQTVILLAVMGSGNVWVSHLLNDRDMYTCLTYEVLVSMVHPVRASVGDILRVRPGHDVAPIRVWRYVAGRWVAIADGPPNYGAILLREDEAIIRELTAVGVLQRLDAA